MSTGHIRPKVRKSPKSAKPATDQPVGNPTDKDVEDVRMKIENWVGLGGDDKVKKPNASETMFPSTISFPSSAIDSESIKAELTGSDSVGGTATATATTTTEGPKSILKKPKYSKPMDVQAMGAEPEPPRPKPKKSVFKQNCIQERDPTLTASNKNTQVQFNAKEAAAAAMAVEGYQPKMDHNKRIGNQEEEEKEENDEPLVFNSLTDMMQMAGNLPSQDLANNPQVLEADLSFTCMAPEDYKDALILEGMEQKEKEFQAQQDNTPDWKKPSPKPLRINGLGEGYTGHNPISDDDEGTYEDDDGSEIDNVFFDLLGEEESEEEEVVAVAPPRAFRALWECLSPLITPHSCAFLKRLQREEKSGSGTDSYLITTTPLSDLESSRCEGFMTMLRMYMTRSLKELDQPVETRRKAEQRLQGLLYTFNFSRPAAKLDSKQWKAMTCVLLETVLFLNEHTNQEEGKAAPLPASATATGMTVDEYRYLVNNTIKTFDIPDPVI